MEEHFSRFFDQAASVVNDGTDDVRATSPQLGEMAEALVPAGLTSRWGDALGWPAWMLEGTGKEFTIPMPAKVRLCDDLVVIGNVLRRFGATELLAILLSDLDSFVSPRTLDVYRSAPDCATLLRFVVKAFNIQNPHMYAAIGEDDGGLLVEVSSLPDLGPLGQFSECAVVAVLARLCTIFIPRLRRLSNGRDTWPRLYLRQSDEQTIARLAAIDLFKVVSSQRHSAIFVPRECLSLINPNADAEAWKLAQESLRRDWTKNRSALSIGSLRLHVRQAIIRTQRAPDLEELARHLGMSKRTISRKLANIGMSFQVLVNEEKMKLARQELLAGSKTAQAVARTLGYSTAASFGRAFRNAHGVSPHEWRARQI